MTSENNVMFRHVMGNDPRPHFMHQSNLADYNPALPETDPNQGGILYPVIDGLLARYDAAFDRASAPLVQLTQRADRRDARPAGRVGGEPRRRQGHRVAAGRRLHVKNLGGAAIDVPLTGTTVGDLYGGQKSGWISIPAGAEQVLLAQRPGQRRGPDRVGHGEGRASTLTAEQRRVDRHAADRLRLPVAALRSQRELREHRRRDRRDATSVAAADAAPRLRVVVSAGNWVSSVSQAAVGGSTCEPCRSAGGGPRSEARKRARSPRATGR